jgi:hypothetical protein
MKWFFGGPKEEFGSKGPLEGSKRLRYHRDSRPEGGFGTEKGTPGPGTRGRRRGSSVRAGCHVAPRARNGVAVLPERGTGGGHFVKMRSSTVPSEASVSTWKGPVLGACRSGWQHGFSSQDTAAVGVRNAAPPRLGRPEGDEARIRVTKPGRFQATSSERGHRRRVDGQRG